MTRALLVCASAQQGGRELVAALAPGFDIVIGVDGGAATCFDASVTPQLLVGDFDSLDPAVLAEATKLGVPVRSYPSDKDETDLVLAIDEARSLGVTGLTVTAATGGRLDHTLGVLAALAGAASLLPSIHEPDLTGWLLSVNGRTSVQVSGIGATLSIVPFTQMARVSASGVRWPLESADIPGTDTVGISNVVCANDARVTIEAGVAYVLSPRMHVAPAEESPRTVSGQDGSD